MKRKIGFMPNGSYIGKSCEEICNSLKNIGFEAVEWTQEFASPRNKSIAELKELVKTSKSYDLEISEIVVQKDLIMLDETLRRDNINYIKECISAYSQIGVNIINLFTGPIPWHKHPLIVGRDISQGGAWDMLFRAFDEILPLAEKEGVILAVENVWGMLCDDFFTNKHLIDHYRSPFLGVNYDPSHDIIAGNSDTGWIVRNWGNNIKHIHLKDSVGISQDGKFVFPLPGEGNVDWNGFSSGLDDIGYYGPMSIEFESFNYVEKVLKGNWEKAAEIALRDFKILFGY